MVRPMPRPRVYIRTEPGTSSDRDWPSSSEEPAARRCYWCRPFKVLLHDPTTSIRLEFNCLRRCRDPCRFRPIDDGLTVTCLHRVPARGIWGLAIASPVVAAQAQAGVMGGLIWKIRWGQAGPMKALFSSQIFLRFLSHRIFGRIHRTLNIVENKTNYTVYL
jgi:hypothetical protein